MCSEKKLTWDETLARKSILLLGDENTDCVNPENLQSVFRNLKDAEAGDIFKGMINSVPFRRLHKHSSPYFRQVYSSDLLLWHIQRLGNTFPVNFPDISSSRTYESTEDLNWLDSFSDSFKVIHNNYTISLILHNIYSIINKLPPMFTKHQHSP